MRVQTLFYELCNASAMGKTVTEAKIIRDPIKNQTVKMIIITSRPISLEVAKRKVLRMNGCINLIGKRSNFSKT